MNAINTFFGDFLSNSFINVEVSRDVTIVDAIPGLVILIILGVGIITIIRNITRRCFIDWCENTEDTDGFFSKDIGNLDDSFLMMDDTDDSQVGSIHELLLLIILGIGIKTIIKKVFDNFSDETETKQTADTETKQIADTETKQTADTETNPTETCNDEMELLLGLVLSMLAFYLERNGHDWLAIPPLICGSAFQSEVFWNWGFFFRIMVIINTTATISQVCAWYSVS